MVDATSKGADESALVAALQAGDEAAYEGMVREHAGRMLAVARRFFDDDADAQDAVQDAFLQAFKAIGRFEGGSRLSTWLHRITVNASLMKLRSRRRHPERSIESMLPRFAGEEQVHVESPAPWQAPVQDPAMVSETRVLVRQRIEELPDNYRDVLMLRDIQQLDTAETAEVLGITTNAVKTRLHRARLALRTLLDPDFREGAA